MAFGTISDGFGGNMRDASREIFERKVTGDSASRSFADQFLARFDRMSSDCEVAAGNCVRILDVGTGWARIPIAICSRRGEFRFTAVDKSTRALENARRNVEQSGMTGKIRVVPADASALPFENASFDAVISGSLLHHVSNQYRVLNEMLRVLRTGGLLFVRDTLKGSDARQIAQILACNSGESRQARPAACRIARPGVLDIDEARALALAAGVPGECVRQSGPQHWLLEFRLQPAGVEVNCSRRALSQAEA